MEQERFFVTVHVSGWEIAAVIVGGLTAFLFLGVLIWTIKTAKEARRANDRADREVDIRLRP